MNRRQKIIVSVTGIFLVLLIIVGLTYAYFLTRINGNTNSKSISVKTANLALVYDDGNGIIEPTTKILPGTTIDSKTFTVKNEGNAVTDYVVVIENVSVVYAETLEVDGVTQTAGTATTFESNDFVYTLTCTSDGVACDGVSSASVFPINGGILVGNDIEVGKTHSYTLTVTYKETGRNQSNDMNKTLTARVNIKDIASLNPYSANTSTLAYNIINNAISGKTGTTLSGAAETNVAQNISGAVGTGKTGLVTLTPSDGFFGWDGLTYGDTADEANDSSTTVAGSTDVEKCNSVIGKYISDSYNCGAWCDIVGKVDACTSDGTPMSNKEIKDYENVLSVTQDDLGTSYYYRGKVEDNYVDFAGKCWRIVRIEGDGAIKLVLEDKDSTCASSDGSWDIGTGHYGYNQTKVTNSSGQQSSGNKYVADYLNSPTNTSTSMKAQFDTWLTSSGIDTSKLKMDTWCLGNTTDPYNTSTGALLTDSVNDLMYNSKSFYYEAAKRLYGTGETANATLRCDGKNDKTFESYIGALTADEVVFAGGKAGSSNYNYYLLNNYQMKNYLYWWSLSPSYFDGNGDYAFRVYINGRVSDYDVVSLEYISLRPAVSLASSAVITGGNGTKTSPYVVG